MTTPFIIYALPRSRTAWVSRFLTYRDWYCGHDEAQHFRSLDDIRSWLSQLNTGTVETAGAPFWRLIERFAPEARVATLRRPIDEVVDSLRRAGVQADPAILCRAMEHYARKLDQIERRLPNVLALTFDELRDAKHCTRLFEHCLPHAFDKQHWLSLAAENIQINMPALIRYVAAYKPQLDKLVAMARQTMLSDLATREPVTEGMTLAAEPFDAFYRDSQHLFADHLVAVGEAPTAFSQKNIPLMQTLDQIGALQTVVARCNGRVFGYLMSVIGPSFEFQDAPVAVHMTFYASPDAPGLGLKLQRASLKLLRERGVAEVVLRAGPRGSGPKMGALYQRCGGVDDGHLYKVEFEENRKWGSQQ